MIRALLIAVTILLLSKNIHADDNDGRLEQVIKGNTGYTSEVFGDLSALDNNFVVSPLSIHAILGNLRIGSGGRDTESYLGKLVDPAPSIHLNSADFRKYLTDFAEQSSSILANKIYLGKDLRVLDEFATTTVQDFRSEVERVDFGERTKAIETINSWIKNKTKGTIEDIISESDITTDGADSVVGLVSALTFSATWLHPFHSAKLHPLKFYVNNDSTENVEPLIVTEEFVYKEDSELNSKIIELPFREGNYSLVIVLPNRIDGIDELSKRLLRFSWRGITRDAEKKWVHVFLPKFRIEQKHNFKKIKTGFRDLFNRENNFSKMISNGDQVKVGFIVQKSVFEIVETGTVQLAASPIQIAKDEIHPDAKSFIADRPFVFLVQSTLTKNILLTGRVLNPTLQN